MKSKYLLFTLSFLLLLPISVNASITIVEKPPNTISWAKGVTTDSYLANYKLELSADDAQNVIVSWGAIESLTSPCSSNTPFFASISSSFQWWGDAVVINVRNRLNGMINSAIYRNDWVDSDVAFKAGSENPYICYGFKVTFVATSASKTDVFVVKIYEKEVPQSGSKLPLSPIPFVAAFVSIVLLKKHKNKQLL